MCCQCCRYSFCCLLKAIMASTFCRRLHWQRPWLKSYPPSLGPPGVTGTGIVNSFRGPPSLKKCTIRRAFKPAMQHCFLTFSRGTRSSVPTALDSLNLTRLGRHPGPPHWHRDTSSPRLGRQKWAMELEDTVKSRAPPRPRFIGFAESSRHSPVNRNG